MMYHDVTWAIITGAPPLLATPPRRAKRPADLTVDRFGWDC